MSILPHNEIVSDDCPYQACSIHGVRTNDGTRISYEEFEKLPPVETLEQKVDRIDNNMTLLLETIQGIVNTFENNPVAKMFVKGMKKNGT